MLKAIGFTQFGGPEVLRLLEMPKPHAGPGQVRVKVSAFDVNPADAFYRSGGGKKVYEAIGKSYASPPYVTGFDFSGVVDEIGSGANVSASSGDLVVGLPERVDVDSGSYAQYVVTDARSVVRAPRGKSPEESATFLMNALTAYVGLEKLALQPGDTLAVTGAAGSLGHYVVQLAKHSGLRVIVDAKDSDVSLLRALGADAVVARGEGVGGRFRAEAPGGVDGLADCANLGDAVEAAVRDGGGLVSFRGHTGSTARGLKWVTLNVLEHATRLPLLESLRDLVENGVLSTPLAQIRPAEQAPQAHRQLEAGGVRGRLVLTW